MGSDFTRNILTKLIFHWFYLSIRHIIIEFFCKGVFLVQSTSSTSCRSCWGNETFVKPLTTWRLQITAQQEQSSAYSNIYTGADMFVSLDRLLIRSKFYFSIVPRNKSHLLRLFNWAPRRANFVDVLLFYFGVELYRLILTTVFKTRLYFQCACVGWGWTTLAFPRLAIKWRFHVRTTPIWSSWTGNYSSDKTE